MKILNRKEISSIWPEF